VVGDTGQGSRAGPSVAGWTGPTLYLMLLVGLEVLALLALRHGFRHHHGG